MSFLYLLLSSGKVDSPVNTDMATHLAPADSIDDVFAPLYIFLRPLTDFFHMLLDWFSSQQNRILLFIAGLIVSFLISALLSWIIRKVLLALTSHTKTDVDDRIINGLHAPLMMLAVSSGVVCSVTVLRIPPNIADAVLRLYYATATLSIVWGLLRVINVLDGHFRDMAKRTSATLDNLLVDLLRRVAKFTIWIVAALFIAQNIFNLNVSALLAGAGVIGLAVAFAAQNTIANIFGAISLILDKPFGIGDRIKMGDSSGMVEAVGLRSTRLRSLDGTVWYVPNRQMSDSSLENYSRRPNLKYSFTVGLVYNTPPEKMRRAVELLHEILDNHPLFDMENLPPRIFFTDFRDWSLEINVIVWFQTQDYFAMQEAKQQLNFTILERFNAEGLEFAFPTGTQYLTGSASAPLYIQNSAK